MVADIGGSEGEGLAGAGSLLVHLFNECQTNAAPRTADWGYKICIHVLI